MLQNYEKLCMRVKEIKYGDKWPIHLPMFEDPVRPELNREFRHTAGREVYTNAVSYTHLRAHET